MQRLTIDNMKRLFLFLCVLISTGAIAQSAKDEQVWIRVGALTRAIFETKDSAALADLVSADVTYGHSGGNIENKKEMVHNATVSPTTYKNPSLERVSIKINKDVAVLRHNFRAISVDDKGTETPLNLGILQVWREEQGKWRIWARQAVKIPPKN